MKKKILICYLFTKFDKLSSLNKFINNYKKFRAGYEHDLLICYKLLNQKIINRLEKKILQFQHHYFKDPNQINDWDFGSYLRVAKKYKNRNIFFMNSHSYPIKPNWLKMFMKHFKKKTIIASTASYESINKQIKLKIPPLNVFSYLKKKIISKNSFPNFPNPHLNTSSFLINSNDLVKYLKNKKFNNKYDTWKLESGKFSLTNFFLKKGYNLLVVNSDGKKFSLNNWKESETYHYKKQTKTIISDKHSRKYLKMNKSEKNRSQSDVWGE